MIRKLVLLAALLVLVALSGLGTPEPAHACPQSCFDECRTWYTYCVNNGQEAYYSGCNFVRSCAGPLWLSYCERYECML